MADTNTTNFALVQPEVGASENTWGAKLNSGLARIDTLLLGTYATTGTANARVITTGLSLAAIPTGMVVQFTVAAANSGAATLNVDATGVAAMQTPSGAAVPSGYIATGQILRATYNGTAWLVENMAQDRIIGTRTLTAGDGLTGGGDLTANRSFAVDSTVLRTTGNQTIAGVKTFSDDLTAARLFADGGDSAAAPGHTWAGNGNTGMFRPAANYIGFTTNGSEVARMRGGTVLVGTTTDTFDIGGASTGIALLGGTNMIAAGRNGDPCMSLNRVGSNGTLVHWRRSGGISGSIDVTTTATTYVTSSDYRLKEDAPSPEGWDAADHLKAISATLRHFTWKETGELAFGAYAHELQGVAPHAVRGEKDAVDDQGNIVPQGVDWSKLVPDLIAALDAALARIEALENA